MSYRRYGKKSGMLPGTPIYIGDSNVVQKAELVRYNSLECKTESVSQLSDLELDSTQGKYWLHVQGLNPIGEIVALGKKLQLHPLLIENILATDQLPKIEEFENCMLIELPYFVQGTAIMSSTEQISLVLGNGYVISFQDGNHSLFPSIKKALDDNRDKIRTRSSDYLYALLFDHVVDSYLPEADKTEDLLGELEERLLADTKDIRETILQNRKRYQQLKKAVTPLKDSYYKLFRPESEHLIQKGTKAYLRDVCNHIDLVSQSTNSYHDMLMNMMSMYVSNNDLRMNRLMQRLTVVSTVFIPLSFLATVWGMNFQIMPELEWKYGYLIAWGIMVLIGIGLWINLRKRMY